MEAGRKRTFDTIFDAESSGYNTRTTDAADLYGSYVNDLLRAINGRETIKKLTKLTDAEGNPLVVHEGTGDQVEETNPLKKAPYMVKGSAMPSGYSILPEIHPLQGWHFAKSTQGKTRCS